ncbi:MAG: glutamine amidotransferase [Planctomycetaceae bacterium]|jgi:hypothetical protein|nr:glutamine amidotransferase [Planctomycetaceae bacterium]
MTPVCYFGDDDITRAAAYLCGVLQHFGIDYDHVNSGHAPSADFMERDYGLYIVSDYPYVRFEDEHIEHIQRAVRLGAGLLMVGGWESFYGLMGEYHGSKFADMLPVVMQTKDDRHNCPQPVYLRTAATGLEHPILANLNWERPPAIGGFNAFTPKAGAKLLLEGVVADVRNTPERALTITAGAVYPMLVEGHYGSGRTAALACDVAPHWVGQMVDWGGKRITQQLRTPDDKPCGFVEFGDAYAKFLKQMFDYLVKPTGVK